MSILSRRLAQLERRFPPAAQSESPEMQWAKAKADLIAAFGSDADIAALSNHEAGETTDGS